MSANPSMLTIRELFSDTERYIIPIYQRNYTWKYSHLRQLIQDIWDSCNYNSERSYYIGTLVVYRTRKGFETVDGQQRLTTLNIILCAIKNEEDQEDNPCPWFNGCNIDFEFREKSSNSLKMIYEHISPDNIEDDSIAAMYELVLPIMEDVLCKNADTDKFKKNLEKFKHYLFESVKITRVLLPDDTDLNHYFEIMNTRGEQLEKHEILKARLFHSLKDSPPSLWLANRIWAACSDMGKYVQFGFTKSEIRKLVFSSDLNSVSASDFDSLVIKTRELIKEENQSFFSINDIFNNIKFANRNPSQVSGKLPDEIDEDRFTSVIDFPNFLLHVLRVMTSENIPLDDKRLLSSFPKNPDSEFTRNFLFQLLKLRFLFDKFIIKRDLVDERRRGKWNILKIKIQENGFSYNNTFEEKQRENVMLQSMFHVSLPSQNYKHWISAALRYLSKNNNGDGFYEYMTQLSHTYMLDRFLQPGDSQTDYYEMIFINDAKPKHRCPNKLDLPRFNANIDIFYFNFLDMQLWLEGKEQDFTFTARNSVEHFYPQHPMDNFPKMNPDFLHNFGNLCLIGKGKNSRLSNFPPHQKTEFYQHYPIDSIKQKLMMDICKRKGSWTIVDIIAHANDMEKTLLKSLNTYRTLPEDR